MYNSNKPSPEELPSARQLLRSTVLALAAAAVILVTIVLPAEYGIDPTRMGRVLGLTEMGQIKNQLSEEAERDRQMDAAGDQSSLLDDVLGLIVSQAHAQDAWQDEISFTLAPNEGTEWKLVMQQGATVDYRWIADGGRINFNLHGDGNGQSTTYDKGRGATGAEGELTAAFTGNHGWFWRNRDDSDITVTLQVRGDYDDLKQTY